MLADFNLDYVTHNVINCPMNAMYYKISTFFVFFDIFIHILLCYFLQ